MGGVCYPEWHKNRLLGVFDHSLMARDKSKPRFRFIVRTV